VKAWQFHGFGDMRLDEVPEPVCGPGHVVVEPLCVQPSVTEAQLAFGIPTLAYQTIKHRLETEAPVQLFGHEFCALVVEVGEGITRVRPGDRVAARAKLPCGSCPLCLEGRDHLCRKGPIIGFQLPGCFAERALLPEIALVRVDDRISDSEAACLQSLSDSVAAVETAGLTIGDSVAIYGQGSMGLECLQIARSSGAGLIVTVDVREESCRISRELGADVAVNARADDPVAAIKTLTHGTGADKTLDTSGTADGRLIAVRGAKPWGTACFVGEGGDVTIEVSPQMLRKQLTIIGSWTFSTTIQADCARFIADNAIDVEHLFTDRWKLAQADEAYKLFDRQTSGKGVFLM